MQSQGSGIQIYVNLLPSFRNTICPPSVLTKSAVSVQLSTKPSKTETPLLSGGEPDMESVRTHLFVLVSPCLDHRQTQSGPKMRSCDLLVFFNWMGQAVFVIYVILELKNHLSIRRSILLS